MSIDAGDGRGLYGCRWGRLAGVILGDCYGSATRVKRAAGLGFHPAIAVQNGRLPKWELHKRSRPRVYNEAGGHGFAQAVQNALGVTLSTLSPNATRATYQCTL